MTTTSFRGTIQRSAKVADLEASRVSRTVTAYATPFDRVSYIEDKYGRYFEKIARSAYSKTLGESGSRVLVLANHGRDLHGKTVPEWIVPVAQSLEVTPNESGLLTRARYFTHPVADAIFEAIISGALTDYSHESAVIRSKPIGTQDGLPVYEHAEMRLYEYGPAVLPHVLEGAEILSVRSVALAERLLEVDVEKLDSTTRADLAAIVERISTSGSTPAEEVTSSTTPREEEEAEIEDPDAGQGPTSEEIEAQERKLSTMRAALEARERRP